MPRSVLRSAFREVPRYQVVVDGVLAGTAFLFAALLTVTPWGIRADISTHLVGAEAAVTVALVLTAVFCAAFALRRVAPGLALGVAWAAALAQMAAGLPPLPGNAVIFGILYTTAAYGTRLVFWLGFASTLVGAVAISVYLIVPPMVMYGVDALRAELVFVGFALFVAAALALLLSWTVGALVRTGIRARDNRIAQELAEAAAAAEQERGRIARDMHDVVAHSLAVVIAQADGARYAATADPDAASRALTTISTTARGALSDVRLLLTQLRHSQADGPQPTLADLEELYAQVRAAGVDLRVDVDPAPPRDVPAAVQLAVYRILQEALTNALRHGADGVVDVRLAWQAGGVRLDVLNPLPSPAPRVDAGHGHGLIGMRERAQLVGGTLTAGAEGDAFAVRAVVPFAEPGRGGR